MILGTWFGAFGAWKYGPWVGLLLGVLGGVLGGMVHAVATVKFNVDHVISGVAINILALGSTRFLSEQVFTSAGGGISQSPPQKSAIQSIDLPFITGGRHLRLEESRRHRLVRATSLVPDQRRRRRSCAAQVGRSRSPRSSCSPSCRCRGGSCGAPVSGCGCAVPAKRRTRRRASGSTSPGCATRAWRSAARWQASAARSWRSWPPTDTAKGRPAVRDSSVWPASSSATGDRSACCWVALLFGFATALRLRDVKNVPALFLVMAIALIVVGLLALRKRHVVAGAISIGCAILAIVGFVTIDEIPQSLTFITPHVLTLIVLASASQRLRPPAWDGKPFRAGESH